MVRIVGRGLTMVHNVSLVPRLSKLGRGARDEDSVMCICMGYQGIHVIL